MTNRDVGVHILVLGTTGSGKTELLLGLCQNALNQGSGFMFVDGKAQDKITFKIMDLVRARGRDDDFLCLNFMTGAKDIIGPQPSKITNTMNPFAYGSSGTISQIVIGLMSSSAGGDDMWKDRAISFIEALSPPLVYLRDNYGMNLDVNQYRKYFELEKVEELAWKGGDTYPGLDLVLESLKNYLLNLPGYDRNKVDRKRGGQDGDTRQQHGYITMQLSRAFTSLADTYGHIVRVPIGEVYFPDLVRNRRILVVMLPSMEKTPAETANIGKIIVTALRNIMAEGLGSQLEGARDDLDNEEGQSLIAPYVVILDEYGYYAVKGFAVAFAQARSLGFVCVVGGQDLASFQKESKEEAVSICGNTRIKAFGSIEDPEQTMDFVVKTAGKAFIAKTQGYDADHKMLGMTFADNMNVHFEAVDRINPTDVKEQIEGQFHIVFRKNVIRAQTYFVDPPKIKKVRLNHFVPVMEPDQAIMDRVEIMSTGLAQRLKTVDYGAIEAPRVREITAAASALKQFTGLSSIERGISTIVYVGGERDRYIKSFREAVNKQGRTADTPDEYQRIAGIDLSKTFIDPGPGVSAGPGFMDDDDDAPPQNAQALLARQSDRDAGYDVPVDAVPLRDVGEIDQMKVVLPPRRRSVFGAEVFEGDSEQARRIEASLAASDDSPLLDFNATLKGVENIERAMGATEEEAGAKARQVVKDIEDVTRYPMSIPKEKSGEQVTDMLQDLLSALENSDDVDE